MGLLGRTAIVVMLLAGSVLGWFSLRPGPEPAGAVSLSLQFSEGDIVRERFRMAVEGEIDSSALELRGPLSVEMEGTATDKVVSVDQRGVATIETSMEDISTTFGLSGMLFPPWSTRVAPDGRVLSFGGIDLPMGSAGTTPLFWDQMIPNLPDHRVRPGDIWTKEYDEAIPFTETAVHLTTRSRFLRYEVKGGVRAALIETLTDMAAFDVTLDPEDLARFSAEVPAEGSATAGVEIRLSSGKTSARQQTWFDFASGTTIAVVSEVDMAFSMGFGGVPGASGDMRIAGRMSTSTVRIP